MTAFLDGILTGVTLLGLVWLGYGLAELTAAVVVVRKSK